MGNEFDADVIAGLVDEVQWKSVNGFYGEFLAPGGQGVRVRYLQTVVGLAATGTASAQLASDLKPFGRSLKCRRWTSTSFSNATLTTFA